MFAWRNALVAGLAAISFGAAEAAYILNTGDPNPSADQTSLNSFASDIYRHGLTHHQRRGVDFRWRTRIQE